MCGWEREPCWKPWRTFACQTVELERPVVWFHNIVCVCISGDRSFPPSNCTFHCYAAAVLGCISQMPMDISTDMPMSFCDFFSSFIEQFWRNGNNSICYYVPSCLNERILLYFFRSRWAGSCQSLKGRISSVLQDEILLRLFSGINLISDPERLTYTLMKWCC